MNSGNIRKFGGLSVLEYLGAVPSGKLAQRWKITILIGKTSKNGPFSIAMLNYHRVVDGC
jgi:hypothetical protein